MNLSRADGSVLIAYVNSRADTNDLLEELLEAHIKHTINTTGLTYSQLGSIIKDVEKHLPSITTPDGKKQKLTLLPENKKPSEYTQSDIVEAYSKIALAHYLYNEEYLPITKGGHQLLREIGRVVDVARLYKTIGDAWHTYANSPEGKAHLANGGKQLADILRESGFKVGSLVAQAKATAQQQIETIEAANWQPDIEAELDALLEEAEAEQQLAEINEQEAAQPITIPAEESITGQEITVEPTSEQETLVSPDDTPESHLRNLIQQGKAKTQDFARFFRDNPAITDAEATEQGIRPLTQKGNPTAAYTQGRLIAAKLTPQQFDDYINGKLKGKALKQALSKPGTSVPTTSNFSIKADGIAERFNIIKNASPIIADTPSAFQPDIKAAIKSVREAYRKLQHNPVTMKDGKVVQFSGNGFHEIKNHAADRRVIAVVPQLKELCETAEFMYSAPNSESNKINKADIAQYHYYLNKASFAGHANDAYILIAIAERTNGEFFYDLDATDIEEIDNIKSATDTLAATRVPNTGQQGGAPKSRLHNLKEFVNNYEQNLTIMRMAKLNATRREHKKGALQKKRWYS